MSKFEELCQAFATARRESELSRQSCQSFTARFVEHFSEYFQCPINLSNTGFDEGDVMHFTITLTLYENPISPTQGASENFEVDLSVEKILDNYIINVYPWLNEFKLFENEFDKFEEVYDYIFAQIKEFYQSGISVLPEDKNTVRTSGWEF